MLQKLIEALEASVGPCRELDRTIHEATNPPLRPGLCRGHVPTYTASLDACLALIDRVLPGWTISFEATDGIASDCYLIGPNYDDSTGASSSPPVGGKPTAIALLICLFRALEAQEAHDVA